MSDMQPVHVPGHGVLTDDGRFYTEDDLRKGLDIVRRMCDWWQRLPEETRDALTAAHIETERQAAMRRGL